jgi:ABC-type phosphate/phosphonate transport system substrate-binding protein
MTRLCTLLLMFASLAHAGANDGTIKVGITEYQNTGRAYSKYRHFFHDVESTPGSNLHFLIAVGTYDEVTKWRDEGKIDLAVLSATPVARLLAVGNNADRKELQDTYLGHLIYFSSPGTDEAHKNKTSMLDLFPPDQREPGRDGYYRTICVVRKDSNFHSLQDIVSAANRRDGSVKFLFVRPYSMSGYIHPRAVLNRELLQGGKESPAGILDAEFTSQHDNSLTRLSQPGDNGKKLVAFVLDQTSINADQAEQLRRIPIDVLEKVKIPQEAVFLSARSSPDLRRRLLAALNQLHQDGPQSCDATAAQICFDSRPSAHQWLGSYADIVREMQSLSLPPNGEARAALSDLVNELKIDKESGIPTRLAVVLSGGGAKCAYQVGALKAITEQFQSLKDHNEWAPEVGLVVGTSGGAINALFYALGLQRELPAIWLGFDQGDLIQPRLFPRLLWGLCTGIACILIVFGLSVLALRSAWWLPARVGLLLLLGLTVYAGQLTLTSLHNHWVFHGVFLLRLSLISACTLLVLAIAITFNPKVRKPVKTRSLPSSAIFVLLVACVALLLFDVFWLNDALTDMAGAKHAFVAALPGLLRSPDIGPKLQKMNSNDVNGKLTALSNAILAPGGQEELQRDLILTASRLHADDKAVHGDCNATGNTLPHDLYFYYDLKSERQHPKKLPTTGDKRFISLRQNPGNLFNVVLGSSTIYPFFRAQKLDCLDPNRPDPNGRSTPLYGSNLVGRIDIIDGGFSHNSPLDAAISWGATHVLLIQASPVPVYRPPSTLASHAGNAFDYLFDQAQGTDFRARGQVKIFELAPSVPCDEWFDPACPDTRQKWLDLVDFAGPLLQPAIDHGFADVADTPQGFTRIPGPPLFVPATPQVSSKEVSSKQVSTKQVSTKQDAIKPDAH